MANSCGGIARRRGCECGLTAALQALPGQPDRVGKLGSFGRCPSNWQLHRLRACPPASRGWAAQAPEAVLLRRIFIKEAVNASDLYAQLDEALNASIQWATEAGASNALRSSRFCSEVGRRLPQLLDEQAKLFHIGFADEGTRRVSGEWLLDAVVAEQDARGCVRKIHVAMECESSTANAAFAWDFGKLLNVRSVVKIYLQGKNQATAKAAESFSRERLATAANLILELDPHSRWYFGFWPSPEKVRGYESLWDGFASGQYRHLRDVRLFQFDGQFFVSAI